MVDRNCPALFIGARHLPWLCFFGVFSLDGFRWSADLMFRHGDAVDQGHGRPPLDHLHVRQIPRRGRSGDRAVISFRRSVDSVGDAQGPEYHGQCDG